MAPVPPSIEQILKLRHIFNKPLSIIPLLVRTKMPARKWTRVINGDPFADHELVDMWTTEFNPGIATGRFSGPGIVVVDADNQQAIDWVEANLPATRMQTWTRDDGRHFYYRAEDLGERIACGTDVLGAKARFLWEAKEKLGLDLKVRQWREQTETELADEQARVVREMEIARSRLEMGPVIDIRADGGQVVAPGAVRQDGSVYRMVEPWTQRMLDEDVPFFSWDWFKDRKWQRPGGGPAKIGDLAAKRQEKELERARDQTPDMRLKRARAWLEHVESAVSGAGGHNKTFYAANRLVTGFCLDPDTAFQLLKDDYNPRCQPPWSDEELAHKIVDAAKNSGQNDGYMLVDRPGFKKKVHEQEIWEASEEDFELDNLIPGPQGGDGAPPASGTPPPELDDDDRYWMRRWDLPFGVDYLQLKRDNVFFARIKDNGIWIIPPTTENISVVLRYSRFLNLDLKFNSLKLIVEDRGQRIDDRQVLLLKSQLDKMWNGKDLPKLRVQDAVDLVAAKRHYEPAQEWLLQLPAWDGVPRLESVPERVLGCQPLTVNGHMFRRWMTGLVARILDPGVKMDTMLIFVSKEQGAGKSKFFKILIDGDLRAEGWFTDNPFNLRDKDGKMLIGTNILVEWSESEHAKSAKMIDTVKAFLSTQIDEFREPYGRHVTKRPRRCVFAGTSNDRELLHDPTGDRRFYIVETGDRIDIKTLKAEREQWFAEALALYQRHLEAVEESDEWHATRWWFTPEEDAVRRQALKRFQSQSAWFDDIAHWLDKRAGEPEPRFRLDEVVEDCLKVTIDKKSKKLVEEVHRTLVQLGCTLEAERSVIGGRRARRWRPPPTRDLEDTLAGVM